MQSLKQKLPHPWDRVAVCRDVSESYWDLYDPVEKTNRLGFAIARNIGLLSKEAAELVDEHFTGRQTFHHIVRQDIVDVVYDAFNQSRIDFHPGEPLGVVRQKFFKDNLSDPVGISLRGKARKLFLAEYPARIPLFVSWFENQEQRHAIFKELHEFRGDILVPLRDLTDAP